MNRKQITNYLKSTRKKIFIASLLSFLVLSALVSFATFDRFEENLLIFIYGASESLWPFALAVTQLGSAWFLICLFGLMLVVKWKANAAISLLVNGTVTYVAVFLAKELISRPRPQFILEGILSREIFAFGFGYPSGHTAMAAAAGFALLPFLPGRLKWLIVPWVALVGWSRIYLGVHAPFDVIGGILLAAVVVSGLPLLPRNILSKYLKT